MTSTPEFKEAQATKRECHGCEKCGKTDGLFSNQHGGIYLCHSCFFSSPTGWPAPKQKEQRWVGRGDPDFDAIYRFTEEQWNRLYEVAKARNDQKRPFKSSKYWTGDPHHLGLLGESLVGFLLGMDVDENLRVGGDGGRDFTLSDGRVANVKTSAFWDDPHLKLASHEKKADVYILCAVRQETREVRFVGWASAEEVKSRGARRDYGHGDRLMLGPSDLNKGPLQGGKDMDARELLKMAEKVLKYIEANADNPKKIREAIQRYRERRNG